MRFSRIELENWKNFRHVAVELPQRVFLVGPNASGKSNFLDAFRFLRDLAKPGGGLQNACEVRGGVSKMRSFYARNPSDIVIRVQLAEGETALWAYEIAMSQNTQYPNPGTPVIKSEQVTYNDEIILQRPDANDLKDPLRLTQTALEQVYFNQDFRAIADFFSDVAYLHLIPHIVRSGVLSTDPNVPDMYGGNFLERVAATKPKTRDSRLRRIAKAMQVAVPLLEELSLDKDDRGIPHLKVRYQNWRPRGVLQDETQLSDGTLRLLALLWLLEESRGTILLEEPELSLHDAIVRRLVGVIHRANRNNSQIMMSTHSADLLHDEGVSGHETLVFTPQNIGTKIMSGVDILTIKNLLENGFTVGEAVVPYTAPPGIEQLSLWA